MLSFVAFNLATGTSPGAGGSARDALVRQAYLIGADDAALQADIRIVDGVIRCEKRTTEAAAICLQLALDGSNAGLSAGLGGEAAGGGSGGGGGGIGVVMVQSCLLPEREAPYLLSLELARHRIMLILNKLEDWALFDLPADDPALIMFEEARHAFTLAVVAAGGGGNGRGFSADADQLGRRALVRAIEAGEALTLKQAAVQHAKRMSGELAAAAAAIATPPSAITEHEAAASRAALIGSAGVILPTPPQVGCIVAPDQFTPQLQKLVAGACDFICMPMRWIDMEPTEGKYAFAKTDRWIEWAVRTAKLPVVGGPVIDFRPRSVPEWLYIWEHDYETLRELVYEHVKTIVTRYRRTVGTWTVVSGLHVNSNFTVSFEQVMDLTRMCVMVVRKLQPSARIVIEVDQPWGEYYAENPRAIPPVLYAEMVSQAGINADLFGLRVEMGHPEQGRQTRDLMAFSALLDRYAALEKPLAITALSAPAEPETGGAPVRAGATGLVERLPDAGYWRQPWSAQAQWKWMTAFIGVAVSKPYVHSVSWHELYDSGRPGDPRRDGLVAGAGNLRPAAARLAEIRAALRDKRAPLSLSHPPVIPQL
jgi:hypothetical protein